MFIEKERVRGREIARMYFYRSRWHGISFSSKSSGYIVFVPNEMKKKDLPPVIFQFIGQYHLIKYQPLD